MEVISSVFTMIFFLLSIIHFPHNIIISAANANANANANEDINNDIKLSILSKLPPLMLSTFEAIYQFGDSIADTGNKLYEFGDCNCCKKPYGQTLNHPPTGRCSDGLLIIDFIAEALGIPFLEPYFDRKGDFRHGVNLAVAGATALSVSTLATKGIFINTTSGSLLDQLDWLKSHLNNTISISTSPLECKQKLGKALFVVGEIGGNDYNKGGAQGKSMEELYAMVPDVIQTIVNVVKEVIDLGAERILVPGNFAVGCMPMVLAPYKVNDSTMYDELNCLKSWNELAMVHNLKLQTAIKDIQLEYPNVAIVYGDYYTPLTYIFKHARSLGFEEEGVHKACCGDGNNEYNFDLNYRCGFDGVSVCKNPDKQVSWDGIHLTQHANRLIADSLLKYNLPFLINDTFSNNALEIM